MILGGPAAFAALRNEFAQPAPPLPGHGAIAELNMTGRTTGHFRGSGPGGAINVVGLNFAVDRPQEPNSRLERPTSVCDGVDFRKPTDAATPALFESISRNEIITTAKFQEHGLTISLADAAFHSVRHVVAGTTGAYEDVTLFPAQIEFVWDATGRTAVHRCGH